MTRLVPTALLAIGIAHPVWASGEEIFDLCMATLNMGETHCTCVAAEAMELSEDQQAFIIAMLEQDDAETERLRGVMPVSDVMEVGMFMPNAATSCASGN